MDATNTMVELNFLGYRICAVADDNFGGWRCEVHDNEGLCLCTAKTHATRGSALDEGIEYAAKRFASTPVLFQAQLRNLSECDDADDFGGVEVHAKIYTAQELGDVVDVLCVACEVDGGDSDFYDVRLPDGTVIAALSGYHLNKINS